MISLLGGVALFLGVVVFNSAIGFTWVYTSIVVVKIGTRAHLITILLSLEFLSLTSLCVMPIFFLNSGLSSPFILAFFTAIVCGACVGLGILIQSTRSLGSDKVRNLA